LEACLGIIWKTGLLASGTSTSIRDELFLLFHALDKAQRKGFRVSLCDTDSMMALELIKSSMDYFHPFFPLVNVIRKLLQLPWRSTWSIHCVKLIHVLTGLLNMVSLMMFLFKIGHNAPSVGFFNAI